MVTSSILSCPLQFLSVEHLARWRGAHRCRIYYRECYLCVHRPTAVSGAPGGACDMSYCVDYILLYMHGMTLADS